MHVYMMYLAALILSEIRHKEKDKLHHCTHIWKKYKQMNNKQNRIKINYIRY